MPFKLKQKHYIGYKINNKFRMKQERAIMSYSM